MKSLTRTIIGLALAAVLTGNGWADPSQTTFKSPQDAFKALTAAAQSHDRVQLAQILGSNSQDGLTYEQRLSRLLETYQGRYTMLQEPDGSVTFQLGAAEQPFPVPLVKVARALHFDTVAGRLRVMEAHR